ncbi:ParA family protein [Listeria booriae]|uniref:ParA family protein n=1 Tax=Listeria booriae TaxID=1552123 RepID=UPI0016272DB1|nr:ParA family protein [Listeria booriae]MBC1553542.1 ParA family protein [Listeria booriae]
MADVQSKPKVISFLNMKGGVGKTTLCKDMAYHYSKRMNKKILVIDIDPQSNCTHSFFERYQDKAFDKVTEFKDGVETTRLVLKENIPSIHNLFDEAFVGVDKENIILNLDDNLDLIPGDLRTVFMGRNQGSSTNEQKIVLLLKQLNLKKDYDFIFIDCPPTYSLYTTAALLATDAYLIPAKPDLYSVLGLDMLTKVVEKFSKVDQALLVGDREITCLGIIITMSSSSSGMDNRIDDIKEFASEKGLYLFEESIPYKEKLLTGKMETFMSDRSDISLTKTIHNVCEEFIERTEKCNERRINTYDK